MGCSSSIPTTDEFYAKLTSITDLTPEDLAAIKRLRTMARTYVHMQRQRADADEVKFFISSEEYSMAGRRQFPKIGSGLSGSSQPSAKDILNLKTILGAQNLIDLDLREEPHFFLDGDDHCVEVLPIEEAVWFGEDQEKLEKLQQTLLDDLESPLVEEVHKPTGSDLGQIIGHAEAFETKQTEEEACEQGGVTYERVSISEGMRPRDEQVDALIEVFRAALKTESWLHCHCRDGTLRTSVVMCMYEMFLDVDDTKLEDITSRHKNLLDVTSIQKLSSDAKAAIHAVHHDDEGVMYQNAVLLANKADCVAFLADFWLFCHENMDALHDVSKDAPKFAEWAGEEEPDAKFPSGVSMPATIDGNTDSEACLKVIAEASLRTGDEVIREGVEAHVFLTRESGSMNERRQFPKLGFGVSGSSQMSSQDIAELKTTFGAACLIDLDLREEPHVFVDGQDVSVIVEPMEAARWYHEDGADAEKFHDDVCEVITSPIECMLYSQMPDGETETLEFTAKTTEEEECEKAGVIYEQVFITEDQAPEPEDVEAMLAVFHQALQKKAWLHCHCRDGSDRTAVALLMYDIFLNANRTPVTDIIKQHKQTELFDLSEGHGTTGDKPSYQDAVEFAWDAERTAFLVRFWLFCNDKFDQLHSEKGDAPLPSFVQWNDEYEKDLE